jgi:hypothetical protein
MPSLYNRQRPDLWKLDSDSRRPTVRFRLGLGKKPAWRTVVFLGFLAAVWLLVYRFVLK